ncbi:MAG: DUF58 domain-containing protein [Thermomicrobiales bacterium]|nr:DUF58 domain-containing protein [Thermomicrobiales bacterium]
MSWLDRFISPLGSAPPAARPDATERVFDEALLTHLRRLAIASGRVRAVGIAGEHRSRRRGSSPEFTDFKSYSIGDDYRRIDWGAYARLDELFVRLSEVTTELDVHLLLDASDSMVWRSDPTLPTKFTYARRLAGALGYVTLWRLDRLFLTPFGGQLGRSIGPMQGRAQMLPMLRALEEMAPLGGTALAESIDRYLHARRRSGVLLVLSDLIAGEPEELRAGLRAAHLHGWQVALLHVLDAAEVAPAQAVAYLCDDAGDANAPVELIEAETGRRLLLSPTGDLVDRFEAAIADWLMRIERVCADEGVSYVRTPTYLPLEVALPRLLRERGVVA